MEKVKMKSRPRQKYKTKASERENSDIKTNGGSSLVRRKILCDRALKTASAFSHPFSRHDRVRCWEKVNHPLPRKFHSAAAQIQLRIEQHRRCINGRPENWLRFSRKISLPADKCDAENDAAELYSHTASGASPQIALLQESLIRKSPRGEQIPSIL